ncbi:MAG: RDD family protein [Acidimicrobiales bacterium]
MTSVAPPETLTVGRQGNYAGAVSRLVAFGIDVGVSWGLFSAGAALLSLATQLFFDTKITFNHHQIVAIIILIIWEFLYFAYSWSVSGKTFGMAVLGIQVVTAEGARITTRQAAVRTLALPLSFLILCLGFLGILIQRERRALHDFIAGTAVVYYWDARAARLRWLSHHESEKKGRAT